jgi:hypothetical protein
MRPQRRVAVTEASSVISEHDELLSDDELEERTGISASTWKKRRITGDTPPYLKIGRRVLYRWRADVVPWLENRIRRSTSDRGRLAPGEEPRPKPSSSMHSTSELTLTS